MNIFNNSSIHYAHVREQPKRRLRELRRQRLEMRQVWSQDVLACHPNAWDARIERRTNGTLTTFALRTVDVHVALVDLGDPGDRKVDETHT